MCLVTSLRSERGRNMQATLDRLEDCMNREEANPGILGQLAFEAIATKAPDSLTAYQLGPDCYYAQTNVSLNPFP